MAVTLNKANLVLKDANGNIGKIEQLSSNDLAKIKTAVSDVALVVNQSNHTPIEATTTNKGVVQLATSVDVASGAIDKVVTAEQLHNATTGTSALATENLARIDAVVTEAGIPIDHTNTNQLKTAVTTLISKATPAKATANTLGVVKPDNNTIKIDSNGVLTATAQMPGVATTTNVGVVKPDGTTITVDGDGTLTCVGKTIAPVTGKIEWFASNTAPDGYLVCNGANVSRETYADLFAKIGTTFGSGDGSTTFTLPNLIDKFAQGSTTVGTVKSAGLPNITGTLTNGRSFLREFVTSGAISGNVSPGAGNSFYWDDVAGQFYCVISIDASKSNSIYGNSTTVQPPALTLLPCIKY